MGNINHRIAIPAAIIFASIIFLSSIVIADEPRQQFGEEFQETLDQINDVHEKIQELIEKYENLELDTIKTEETTVTDQNGNLVECNIETYYTSDYVVEYTTSTGGPYVGNFNHGNRWPGQVVSYRLSGCPCRVRGVTHHTSFPGFDEHFERLKSIITDEITDYASEQAGELAEEAVEKGFDALGAGELAGPFLAGFSIGAELGAPFGEALTQGLNNALESSLNANRQRRDLMRGDDIALEPANYRRITARWWDLGRTAPIIKNLWNFQVECGSSISTDYSRTTWQDPRTFAPRTPRVTTGSTGTTTTPGTGQTGPSQDEINRRAEENARREREAQERREAEARARAEAERRAREAELARAEQEIRTRCLLCEPIRAQIEDVSNQIAQAEARIAELQTASDNAASQAERARRDLERAQQRLNDFDNPRSSASSGGRTTTSSDLEIDRQVARENWERYRNGEQSAQETSDNWRDYSDADRARARENHRTNLQKAITDSQAAADAADEAARNAASQLSMAQQSLAGLRRHLDDLKRQLDDCLKKCQLYARFIAENQGITYAQLVEHDRAQTPQQPPKTTPVPPKTQPRPKPTGPCERYAALVGRYRLTPAQFEGLSEEKLVQLEIPEGMEKAIDEARRDCSGAVMTSQPTQQTAVRTSTPTTTGTTGTTTTTPPPSMSCDQICSSRGMSTQQRDWTSHILSVLNGQGACAKSASINFGSYLSTGSCTCYPTSEPSIQISSEKLVCRGSACGDVPCGGSASCSCGTNCIQTIECRWGGWRKVGDTAYQPVAGVVAMQ